MTIPSFTAEASLYATSEHYRSSAVSVAERLDSILAQQLCRQAGQRCFGLEFSCCPGLECAPSRLNGICVPCPPCGPCQINLTTGGCSQVCYTSRPLGRCFSYDVPCDPSACCAESKQMCIAEGLTVCDCSDPNNPCGILGGCAACPPCCFVCSGL
jgi:hypothetical protein